MQPDAIRTSVERYYTSTFEEHGATARGVDWNSVESQELRFEQFLPLFRDTSRRVSVNDLGSGTGAFASYLARHGIAVDYVGYELSRPMLAHAAAAFADDPTVRFVEGSVLEPADVSCASGIFNVKLTHETADWETYVAATVDALAEASREGFAFNMLSTYSDLDRRRDDLYYADPCAIFDRCKRQYSRNVALLHDYGLWEFTILVRLGT
jgi:SAM-dependent methyltransferase